MIRKIELAAAAVMVKKAAGQSRNESVKTVESKGFLVQYIKKGLAL